MGKAEKIQKDNLEVIPSDFSMILGQKDSSGNWQVVLPSDTDPYLKLLNIFPEFLFRDTTKEYIREASYNVNVQAIYSNHYLPWTKDTAAVVYQNYSTHGEGQLDFGFDGSIRTTKAGTLYFAYDSHTWSKCTGKTLDWCKYNYKYAWYYNNAVVIKHADGQYSAYLHLQTGSIPTEIINNCNNGNGGLCAAVNIPVGTIIGAVGSIGLSTVAHLHYGTGDLPFGRCDYKDVYDEDGDGDTNETNICSGGIDGTHLVSTNFHEKPYTATNCGTGAGQDPTLCMLYYPKNTNLISQNPGSTELQVDPTTRTIENSLIKISWDLNTAERVDEFYFKPFNLTWNLAGTHYNEFFGNAQAFGRDQSSNVSSLVNSFNVNNTWQYKIIGQTAVVEISSVSETGYPITTKYTITVDSPIIKIERTFGFGSQSIGSSRIVTYFLRAYDRGNFSRYAWENEDGSISISDDQCEFGCSPIGWKQTWIDVEAPNLNVGLELVNLSTNLPSLPWLDRDSYSQTAYISAAVPTDGLSQDLTVSYLIIPHLGDYSIVNKTFIANSKSAQDGWVLESSETSNKGGTFNFDTTTFNLGNDAARRQYRAILSFSTAGLPDNAVITSVTLKIKKQSIVGGGNPFKIFKGLMADVKKGSFGIPALSANDFQLKASQTYGPFIPSLSGGWYSIDLTSAKDYINTLSTLSGLTQIRLRFNLDDNNNAIANYIKFYSGNAPNASRPVLIVTYYAP